MEYTIELESNGQTFSCAEDEPILDAALRADVDMPYNCQSGTCSTCMGQVVEGEFVYPDGRPMVMSDQFEELGFALFCSAHPRSNMKIKPGF